MPCFSCCFCRPYICCWIKFWRFRFKLTFFNEPKIAWLFTWNLLLTKPNLGKKRKWKSYKSIHFVVIHLLWYLTCFSQKNNVCVYIDITGIYTDAIRLQSSSYFINDYIIVCSRAYRRNCPEMRIMYKIGSSSMHLLQIYTYVHVFHWTIWIEATSHIT